MSAVLREWDYLIVTASNDPQARIYEEHLSRRVALGLLTGVKCVLVVGDPGGRRIGSGGSTLYCLMQLLERELDISSPQGRQAEAWLHRLQQLRILIVHAGGDSKRLPAYGPCGKIFIPVPGPRDRAVGTTLFDRQIDTFLALSGDCPGRGQVVVTSGDVLLGFDPSLVALDSPGMVGLATGAKPAEASRHGVFCPAPDGSVKRFLQKPDEAAQRAHGAVDRYGQAALDIGVTSFGAQTAVRLLETFGVKASSGNAIERSGDIGQAIEDCGLDFYREICCAMGSETTLDDYLASASGAGSTWPRELLTGVFQTLREIPFNVQLLPDCGFLHFGTTSQIITSGQKLLRRRAASSDAAASISINNEIDEPGGIDGSNWWVEGCRVSAPLSLAGQNVVVGADIRQELSLPKGACFDVLPGVDEDGCDVHFMRCYGVGDKFKDTATEGATWCGKPLLEHVQAVGLTAEDVWESGAKDQSLWNARLFATVADAADFGKFLWLLAPDDADPDQRRSYRHVKRYTLAEMALMTDQDEFDRRRRLIHCRQLQLNLRHLLRPGSEFSALDLAEVMSESPQADQWVRGVLSEARWQWDQSSQPARSTSLSGALQFSRTLHTLASAITQLSGTDGLLVAKLFAELASSLDADERSWLEDMDLAITCETESRQWCAKAWAAAFAHVGRTMMAPARNLSEVPRSVLRPDEIVWGRTPARLDLGGGWTDTPPYTLEHGGCVINAAVDLNGQPPVQCYARVIEEPVVRIGSIDLGTQIEIRELDDLLDFRTATSGFALAKGALALSGLSPNYGSWPAGTTLAEMLEHFGGGIELTTLAAIPKGSGLGTSSIVGAVILAVVNQVMGRRITRDQLFHRVLQLEQALTTGGGWQDQVGGVVDGVKLISTTAGMIPSATIHYVPGDVLDPRTNDGCTLLYYTGITRLAKNILQQVVGRYLDRDRSAMATLAKLRQLPAELADAMARKDMRQFGQLIDVAWRLNKQLDPDSSNDAVEELLARVSPYVHGAKLLGAGGGGFLLMVCRSPQDAGRIREMLTAEPSNERARFFDFSISRTGLSVTTC